MFEAFLEGFGLLLRVDIYLYICLGLTLGMFVGAMPGLTTTLAMAILLPVSFKLEPMLGIPFLIGVYKGGIYGGSIPAILVGIRARALLSRPPSTAPPSPGWERAARLSKWRFTLR